MATKRFVVPTIHLNGTAKRDLQEAIATAGAAILKAEEALRGTCPHARDYYVQPVNGFTRAVEEYVSRKSRLESVYQELVAVFSAIDHGKLETAELISEAHSGEK